MIIFKHLTTNIVRKNIHKNDHLQASYNKYSKQNFIFEILEYVENIDDLLIREQYWMDKTQCYNRKFGYNICPKAGSNLGYKHTEETKLKMSLNHADVSGENNGFYGKHHTEEALRKSSEAHKGKKLSDEHKEKISIKVKGNNNPAAKLTEIDVAKIKKLFDMNIKLVEIAKVFNVSATTICDIKKGRIWSYVKPVDCFNEEELVLYENLECNNYLSDEQVVEIKEMLKNKIKQKDIAIKYNVNRTTISDIKNNRTHTNIEIEGLTNEELKLLAYNTGENNGMYGKHLTEETKRKISEKNKNKIVSDETRKKQSISLRGINNGNAKLNEEQVNEIKVLISQNKTLKEIANIYNVTIGMVSNIKVGRSWNHLYTEEDSKTLKKFLLSNEQVIEIKMLLNSNIKQVEIARMYNVSPAIISNIKLRKCNIYKL